MGMQYIVVVAAIGALGCSTPVLEDTACKGASYGTECGSPTPFGELSGRCYDGACCTGCWDGHRCHSGVEEANCGYHGDSCVQCGAGYACKQATAEVAGKSVVAAQLCQSSARTVCQTTDGVERCYDCGEVGQRCCDADACVQGAKCIVDMFNVHECVAATTGS